MSTVFTPDQQQVLYDIIAARRDVRRFLPTPVPEPVLQRILTAAAQAPSVGYMQPTNFILINNMAVRAQVHAAFVRANTHAATLFAGKKQQQYTALKLEGILESGLNVCITCDRNRFGPVVLGRTAQPNMDLYSTVCAVQNFWLAARAQNIGVGWVSIIDAQELASILQLPPHVEPVAYLCVGYTAQFASEPEFKTSGWLPTLPLEELIFYDQWGNGQTGLPDKI